MAESEWILMDDKFRAALYNVFQNNGHSKPRARALYEEVEDAIEALLVAGELRIKGLLTVKVSAKLEKVYDGFSGDSRGSKVVVRAGATVRPRLRKQVQERHNETHETRLPSDMTLPRRKLD